MTAHADTAPPRRISGLTHDDIIEAAGLIAVLIGGLTIVAFARWPFSVWEAVGYPA